jgi:hypothetical protein
MQATGLNAANATMPLDDGMKKELPNQKIR